MQLVEANNCVLDKDSIKRKLRRMALEVAENNVEEKELIIAAVNGNGEVVAKLMDDELKNCCSLEITMITINLNKKDPLNVRLSRDIELKNKVVLIVDDVANSGRTMLFALKPFLSEYTKKIQTLVLVERSHKRFPIQTDYSGLSIATTLQEHIAVETKDGELLGAWLS